MTKYKTKFSSIESRYRNYKKVARLGWRSEKYVQKFIKFLKKEESFENAIK